MELIKIRYFIVVKDLMIGVIYFILLKFNITRETYTDEMISQFPAADEGGFLEILFVSVYMLWIPILIDLIILHIFYRYLLNNASKINDFFIGVILNIPIIFILILVFEGDMNRAMITSFIITTFLSGLAFPKMKKMAKE